MRPVKTARPPSCWHCGEPVIADTSAARYIYPGPSDDTAIVEDWLQCRCGAFQNVRRLSAITIAPLRAS